MKTHTSTLVAMALLALLVAVFLAACGGSPEQAPAATQAPIQEQVPASLDGQALVQDRCTKCHSLGRVEQARKSAADWKTTVERMVTKGAALNPQEQEAVIAYLTQSFPK